MHLCDRSQVFQDCVDHRAIIWLEAVTDERANWLHEGGSIISSPRIRFAIMRACRKHRCQGGASQRRHMPGVCSYGRLDLANE